MQPLNIIVSAVLHIIAVSGDQHQLRVAVSSCSSFPKNSLGVIIAVVTAVIAGLKEGGMDSLREIFWE